MISLFEQLLTKRQRTIKYNKLRMRNNRISSQLKSIRKDIRSNTTFNNPLISKIKRLKYKAIKGNI